MKKLMLIIIVVALMGVFTAPIFAVEHPDVKLNDNNIWGKLHQCPVMKDVLKEVKDFVKEELECTNWGQATKAIKDVIK